MSINYNHYENTMRITGGIYRGVNINTIKINKTLLRPTSSKVRLAIFDALWNLLKESNYYSSNETLSIENAFKDLNFLDVCAGTGIMGIEAISRGFFNICFIE